MKTFKKDNRNLVNLYELMAEEVKSSKNTFSAMSELSGRAAAAANQISRVGANERGSILSTSYRQVDWIGDKNMQKTLMDSTFDLRDFLKGNMDIYVVLPQEQVREHSRLMRILLSLLKYLILSADPDELPHKKMLFLLDELAQLGYCPDVEEFIEVLRSRGVVIWTVFQSNDQIELYKKPDLFRGMPMKQIFTLDDVPTMRWIQALGGKESVITQSFSKQKGHSWRESGLATGHSSHTEASSRHETGVDLIQLSDIREMPNDEQIIFIHGQKPVRCKKAFYFEHPFFAGKFDENPLERRKQ
jgi:type IV secretion system protein VirD4